MFLIDNVVAHFQIEEDGTMTATASGRVIILKWVHLFTVKYWLCLNQYDPSPLYRLYFVTSSFHNVLFFFRPLATGKCAPKCWPPLRKLLILPSSGWNTGELQITCRVEVSCGTFTWTGTYLNLLVSVWTALRLTFGNVSWFYIDLWTTVDLIWSSADTLGSLIQAVVIITDNTSYHCISCWLDSWISL